MGVTTVEVMATIDFVTLEVADLTAAERFYATAFDVGPRLRLRESAAPTAGFRGFTISLLVTQPAGVDTLVRSAVDAGATALKPAASSLWGYGGVVQAPDGTVWTVASSSKKDTGPARREIDDVVLQLGVADVEASKRFYADHGLTPTKSFGRRYAEFDTGPVKLTLNKRAALAKVSAVPSDGSGAHRLAIGGDLGPLTDPDGFEWERASA